MIIICLSHAEALNSPQVTRRTEDYNTDNVTVALEWREEAGVSYSISATPSPLRSRLSGNMSQLTILYNISYSVVVSATLCGQNMNMTAIDIAVDYVGKTDVFNVDCLSLSLSLNAYLVYVPGPMQRNSINTMTVIQNSLMINFLGGGPYTRAYTQAAV